MKILLTGATGFLGSHILRGLLDKNIQTIILIRSSSNHNRIEKYKSQFTAYDIEKIGIKEVFEKEPNIDAIIHCATNYGRNNEKLIDVFQSNISFPLELIEMATKYNIKYFINSDSALCKAKTVKGYMQNYLLTKKQFIEWGKLFAESGKIKFINMRLEHLYGEADDNKKFTSFIIQSCMENVEKIDLTDGEQLRDFIYIEDAVAAYLTVLLSMDKISYFQEFEIGTGEVVRVKDFVNSSKELTNSKTVLDYGVIPYRENEIVYSKADISQLQKLGWSCKYDLKRGIASYISKVNNY